MRWGYQPGGPMVWIPTKPIHLKDKSHFPDDLPPLGLKSATCKLKSAFLFQPKKTVLATVYYAFHHDEGVGSPRKITKL